MKDPDSLNRVFYLTPGFNYTDFQAEVPSILNKLH